VALAAGLAAGLAVGLAIAACATHPAQPRLEQQEIMLLWAQIRQWRHEAKMELEPAASSVIAMRRLDVRRAAAACPDGHEPPAACADVCDVADAICDNAERICDLAGQLADSPWAAWSKEKCDSAKGSCREAKERCCACERTAGAAP
jgi:hypothetical protein